MIKSCRYLISKCFVLCFSIGIKQDIRFTFDRWHLLLAFNPDLEAIYTNAFDIGRFDLSFNPFLSILIMPRARFSRTRQYKAKYLFFVIFYDISFFHAVWIFVRKMLVSLPVLSNSENSYQVKSRTNQLSSDLQVLLYCLDFLVHLTSEESKQIISSNYKEISCIKYIFLFEFTAQKMKFSNKVFFSKCN